MILAERDGRMLKTLSATGRQTPLKYSILLTLVQQDLKKSLPCEIKFIRLPLTLPTTQISIHKRTGSKQSPDHGSFCILGSNKNKISSGKTTGTTEDRILRISKNLCTPIQNTCWFRCQLCNDIHSEAKGGECGKEVPGFNEKSFLSYSNVNLP